MKKILLAFLISLVSLSVFPLIASATSVCGSMTNTQCINGGGTYSSGCCDCGARTWSGDRCECSSSLYVWDGSACVQGSGLSNTQNTSNCQQSCARSEVNNAHWNGTSCDCPSGAYHPVSSYPGGPNGSSISVTDMCFCAMYLDGQSGSPSGGSSSGSGSSGSGSGSSGGSGSSTSGGSTWSGGTWTSNYTSGNSGGSTNIQMPTVTSTGVIANPISTGSFADLIGAIIAWVRNIALTLAPLIVVYGGFLYLTSAGDANKIKTAKQMILYAAIGFIIVLLAQSIIGILGQLVVK